MKTLKLFAACLLAALAVSCQKDPMPEPRIEVVELDNNIDDTRFDGHIAFLGSECEYFEKFRSRGLVTDTEDASVIIIDQKSLEAFNDDVDKAFNENKFIVVCNFDYNAFKPMQQENGWLCTIPEKQNSKLLGFSRYGILILIEDDEVIEIKDPEFTPDSDGTNTIPSEVLPADDNVIENYVYKEQDPFDGSIGAFIGEINDLGSKYEKKPYIDGNVLYVSLLMEWKVKLLFAQTALSNWDYVEGTYYAASRYAIKPLYAFTEKRSPGDYYIVDVDYVSKPSNIWKGDDQIRTHGLVDVHFTGAFVRKYMAETSISSNNISIIQGTGPFPETGVGKTTTETTITWENEGGIVSGLLFPDTKLYSDPQYSWGTKNTKKLVTQQADWEIKQTTTGEYKPSWEWESQNLPKKNGKRHFSRKCPPIACSAATLRAHWIWRYNGPIGEGSDKSIGQFVTKIHPILGIQRNGYWFSYEEYVYDIGEKSETINMPIPQRIPFGTFKVHNDLKAGTVISNITVKDAAGKVLFTSKGDFRYDQECEISVKTGTYDVFFTAKDGPTTTNYKSVNKIPVEKRVDGQKLAVYEASSSFRPI